MYDERAINPLNATPETTRVVVSNYVCMAVTMIILIARAGLNLKWKRKPGLDDLLLYLALGACITESVLTENAVKRGLGTFIRPGNSSKLRRLSEVCTGELLCFRWLTYARLSMLPTSSISSLCSWPNCQSSDWCTDSHLELPLPKENCSISRSSLSSGLFSVSPPLLSNAVLHFHGYTSLTAASDLVLSGTLS